MHVSAPARTQALASWPRWAPAWAPPAMVGAVALGGCVVLAAFDPERTDAYPTCPFRALTGRACPGCGLTRGLHHMLTGHPVSALRLNLLLAVALPGLLYLYARWALPRWGGPTLASPRLTGRQAWWILGVLVAFGVLRNLPLVPFSWFSSLS